MKINKTFIHDTFYVFAVLCVFFIPFPFHLFPFRVTELLFGRLIQSLADLIPGIVIVDQGISSDSASMYLLFVILFLLAVLIAVLLMYIAAWRRNRDRILPML